MNENYELKPTDMLKNFKDKEDHYLKAEKYKNAIEIFRGKLQENIDLYLNRTGPGRCPEALMLMLGRVIRARFYDEIRWNQTDGMREWIKHNWFRDCQLLNPEGHQQLMQSENDYSRWFKEAEGRIQHQGTYREPYKN